MKVTLREKQLKNGMRSLYLDFYPPITTTDGKGTRREFLKLYIFQTNKPKGETQRDYNKETLMLAENVRSQRQLALQAGNYGFVSKAQKKADFLAYFRKIADEHKTSESAKRNWENSLLHFTDFCSGKCTFEQINKKLVEDFKEYLKTCPSRRSKREKLSHNTAADYFARFRSVIEKAVQDKYLTENPAVQAQTFVRESSAREFLTFAELQTLYKTETNIPDDLRRAALLSALTGLRFSDIQALKWENVRHSEELGHHFYFRVPKTNEIHLFPFSNEAFDLIGERTTDAEKVFPGLRYSAMTNINIARWTLSAGITRKITFHAFRHTYASLQLIFGTDIFTVSKMLGHKNVKTTQIYTHLIDEKKREAANKIKLS